MGILPIMKKNDAVHAAEHNLGPLQWPSLTGLRGLAALWVFWLHVYSIAGEPESVIAPFVWLSRMGSTGVDVFFTLSAFLLSMPYAKALRDNTSPPATLAYLKRRAARVLPAYYLQLLLLSALAAVGLAKTVFWYEPTWQAWTAHVFLWINAQPFVPALVPVWWTLPVELGFYLLLPWLARCLTDRRWYWLLLGIALSLFYRHWILSLGLSRQLEIAWADHLPGRLFQFLIGMLAAFFYIKWRKKNLMPSAVFHSLAFVLAGAILILLPMMDTENKIGVGVPTAIGFMAYYHLFASLVIAAILLLLACRKTVFEKLLSAWPLQWLGNISYGLYLWHYPVMLVLREQMGGMQYAKTDFTSFLMMSFLISVTLAFLSRYWVEVPILRRFSRSSV
jgi:peptidoglycan/LPS O-acetylase OafA/YrhL